MKNALLALLVVTVVSCSQLETEPDGTVGSAGQNNEPTIETAIEMTEEAQEHIGMEAALAETRMLREYLQVTGTVQPIDRRVGHIRPLASGRITDVSVQVGDRVVAGQVLATFDNLEAGDLVAGYQSARADLKRFTVQLSVAQQQTERNRRLSEIGAIPQKEYELSLGEVRSIEASIQAQQSVIGGLLARLQRFGLEEENLLPSMATPIRAPFRGVVTRAEISPGEAVETDTELFEITDISEVWVQAEVYEKDLGRVQVGQTALIRVATYPEEEFTGQVTYVSDILDPETRTARVRVEVPNPDGRLKLDMFVTTRLPTTFERDALAVPFDSIQQIDGLNIVFVRTGETTFEQREVTVGSTVEGVVEILGGLDGGEDVVTRGAFHLKSIVLGDEIGEEDE